MKKAKFIICNHEYASEYTEIARFVGESQWLDISDETYKDLINVEKRDKILSEIQRILESSGEITWEDRVFFVIDPVPSFSNFEETIENARENVLKREEEDRAKKEANIRKAKEKQAKQLADQEAKEKQLLEDLRKKYGV